MITGKTGVFFMVADPIEQVRTPEIFNQIFPLCEIDAVMVPLQVAPEHLEATVRALFRSDTTRGMVLSIPHKSIAAGIVERKSKGATVANAVNAIRRNANGELEGELFDGLGFVKSMDRYAMPYQGKSTFLVGAGGAASAIAAALVEGGVPRIGLYDPDTAKARDLAASLSRQYGVAVTVQDSNDPAGYELVINASPLGLKAADPLPVPAERIDAGAQVCDILMKNQPTPLLQAAIKQGKAVLPGFDMLILQSPLFLDFFGVPAAADLLRRDDSIARDMLFPAELRDLVRKAA
ncbi:shikimate dehydrogenase family protein [Burkholderia sp. Ac-20379]|uniref:shikimate dehydrogenase family protein n=1 Tax=Burkholderia sp. Ac-20379 TaxID=2703900 RepID=UPI00197D655D|nr:shikimate dehydrogenase [Burkholderia sp. Ac-20379]MBN3724400.1 shikimate dehydrogenase [Burkholderia sp. Ac-20379]